MDIAEQPCWGFDCCTYKNILSALAMCSGSQPKHTPNSEDFASERRAFIERRLLPAIQQSGSSGWNLLAVIEKMQLRAAASGNDNESNICCMLASTISGMASQEVCMLHYAASGCCAHTLMGCNTVHRSGAGVLDSSEIRLPVISRFILRAQVWYACEMEVFQLVRTSQASRERLTRPGAGLRSR